MDVRALDNVVIRAGARVGIRHLRASDRDAFVALRRSSRAHLEPWEPIPPSGVDLYSDDAFARELAMTDAATEQRWAIVRLGDGELLGRVTLGAIERGAFLNGRFGYWIGAAHAGQGYMTEALTLCVAHAFAPVEDGGLGLHRLCANIVPWNVASRKLLERVGFVKEGYSEKYLQIGGVWADHERWAMTVERWGGC